MSDLVFVGTSDAFGAGGRRQSAVLVRGARGTLLVDCGATTGSGLAELGIDRNEIDAIVVSHFHADHFGGIPQLLLAARYVDARRTPLWIAGPPEVETRVRALAAAMGHPLDTALAFDLRFVELAPGRPHEIGPARVESFATRHQIESNPHGYRIDAGGASIAYSGDTGWFDALPRAVAGADLFICECTQHARGLDFHLSLEELAEHRHEFDCGRMLLTHLGAEMHARRGSCGFETADDGLALRL